jgi:hypothetical protein
MNANLRLSILRLLPCRARAQSGHLHDMERCESLTPGAKQEVLNARGFSGLPL